MNVSQTLRSFLRRAGNLDRNHAMEVGAVMGAFAGVQSVELKGFTGFLKAALVGALGCVAGMAIGLGLITGMGALSSARLGAA